MVLFHPPIYYFLSVLQHPMRWTREALTTITLFGEASKAHFTGEEGIAGPDGPSEDAGGVGGCCHGDKFSVVMPRKDVLGFVDDEEQRGGIAKDV